MNATKLVAVNLQELETTEFIGKEFPKQHCRATFPLVGAHGTQQLATVYFEIAPGDNLGRHTDSAEELLVILEGDMLASIGEEEQQLRKGSIALVPEMVPHDLKNVGTTTAKVLGVFGGKNNIVASFDNEWLPVNSKVVDTALLFQS